MNPYKNLPPYCTSDDCEGESEESRIDRREEREEMRGEIDRNEDVWREQNHEN